MTQHEHRWGKWIGPVALATAIGLIAPTAQAGPSAKLEKVQTLLSLTGAERLSRGIAVQMIARIRGAFPKVPESFWRKMVLQADVKGLLRQMARVYARHLTDKDVAGLLAFYQSPIGRRFVKLQPKLMRESMGLGRAWSQQLAKRVADELKAKGYIKGRGRGKARGGKTAPGKKSRKPAAAKPGPRKKPKAGRSGGLKMR
jgi:hypothetical protein